MLFRDSLDSLDGYVLGQSLEPSASELVSGVTCVWHESLGLCVPLEKIRVFFCRAEVYGTPALTFAGSGSETLAVGPGSSLPEQKGRAFPVQCWNGSPVLYRHVEGHI